MQNMFDGVQLFVEVVEAGSFAKAGERLSLTRSTIGKAIARLEMRLGVQLFQRTTRVQSLTEDSQQYYERCLRAIKELRAGEAMLEQGRREVAGRLHVSLPVLFGRHCVAPILRTYAREHPQLELELNFSDHHVDLIADGFDLAVRNGPLGNGTTLRARRLGNQRKILCASPTYLAARGKPHTLADLADHDLLTYWRNDRKMAWTLPDATGALVDIPVTSRLRCNDLEVIADTAVDGMGVAWLPYWLLMERMQRGELIGIWGDRPSAVMECHVVWPAAQHVPLRSRLAINLLAAELPKYLEA
ncbi:LysR family transcriptional regulator [Xylella fastidiosa subsp. multiplex]|uniref:LysR family transcriptional regulator n=1 Tax=Xylella fastidiosa TaxID=2371 RepID=UPI001463B062|nr:LysR family transcriptional regulator [Xylella fastidiosa]QJP49892.1 LysR family transcriptional regulator [Xylella fastidiosa subsp. multiplex]QJP55420.1 LysR family transcriptional regulator [Xylella fastidiosa subsp. multiplex]